MTLSDALVLGVAALVPVALLSLTSFVKISMVLALLRSALGTPEAPSSLVVLGVSLVLSAVVMAPVVERMGAAGEAALRQEPAQPAGAIAELVPAPQRAQASALWAALEPLRQFAADNAGERERQAFAQLAASRGETRADSLSVVAPAFIASELRRAFTMAIALLLPFLVIDLVVGLGLAALGTSSLSPQVVALPLKLLLFLAVDGWRVLLAALVRGYT